MGFNPLFIGAWVRTSFHLVEISLAQTFQSPLHRGLGSDDWGLYASIVYTKFQSPLHRGLGSDLRELGIPFEEE